MRQPNRNRKSASHHGLKEMLKTWAGNEAINHRCDQRDRPVSQKDKQQHLPIIPWFCCSLRFTDIDCETNAVNVKQTGTERRASCFSRAARRIRGFLSGKDFRICKVKSANNDPNQTFSPLATNRRPCNDHVHASKELHLEKAGFGGVPHRSTLSIREMGSVCLRGQSVHTHPCSSHCEDVYTTMKARPRWKCLMWKYIQFYCHS